MKNSRRRKWRVLPVIVFSLCLLPQRIGMSEIQEKIEGVTGRSIWKYMTEATPYQRYPSWPGKEGFYESTMPPGDILKLYLNTPALDTVINKRGVFPHGSLLIKEIYTDDRELFLVTVMYKVKGFYPEGNDWYWVKYSSDGEVRLEGKVTVCIECHVGVADNDYIFTGPVK
ncbi:MAG: cytochrome P460 family protein [Candidatus Brocadiaceae bacterium]|nr:cytochrome P460 family protein [Candidatus Brocadiaceae bacterium]